MNASDDRGISVVRERILNFASTRTIFKSGFKLVILDEADAMTNDAQNALRRGETIFLYLYVNGTIYDMSFLYNHDDHIEIVSYVHYYYIWFSLLAYGTLEISRGWSWHGCLLY